jgi:hypothetical protein
MKLLIMLLIKHATSNTISKYNRSQFSNENVPDEQNIGDYNKKPISYANVCKTIIPKVDTIKKEPTLEDRIWYI